MHPHIRRPAHIPFFRIFYSTTFTILTLILAAAVLITPGDHIYQAFRAGQLYHIFTVAGFYVLTFIVALLFYGGRLYKTRTALAGIPREWNASDRKTPGMQIKRVAKEIQVGLDRSAWIAYEARPRDLRGENRAVGEKEEGEEEAAGSQAGEKLSQDILKPAWGTIAHPGWSSPSSNDLPNLHYEPVILELPHLIEAKAVSLAPQDPLYDSSFDIDINTPAPPDPLAVELLQRPVYMGLRKYIAHLTTLNMIVPAELGTEFVAVYEQARFAGEALDEVEFRGLLDVFAEVLREMKPLNNDIMEDIHAEEMIVVEQDAPSETSVVAGDAESVLTNETVAHTPRPDIFYTPRPDAYVSDYDSESSVDRGDHKRSPETVHTAPSRPSNPRTTTSASGSTTVSRRRGVHTPSIGSLKMVTSASPTLSAYSGRSAAGSVIRLADARTELDLPYEFVTGGED